MKGLAKLLSLPASLVLFTLARCAADAHELPWPHNLPRTVQSDPEDEAHVRRGLEAQERLTWQTPVGVRKMGHDPGEKFYLDYWEFGEQRPAAAGDGGSSSRGGMSRPAIYQHEDDCYLNATTGTVLLLAPHAPHLNHESIAFSLFGRGVFARDFQCPAGTTACSNIGSSLCCNTGETCVRTPNSIGCCPSGETCGQTVAGCDTAAGYSSCPSSGNGGCCLPGAECYQTGCAFFGTSTSTTTLPTVTVTTGSASSSAAAATTPATSTSAGNGGTTVIIGPGGTTTTVTISQQGSRVTTTVVSPTTIIISPVSTDISTSTATAAPPVRPTSSASSSNTAVPAADSTTATVSSPTTAATTAIVAGCPTGFYMCSAVFLGGCCQVNRDCNTTSCPPTATTDVVTSGLTIAAAGTDPAAPTCATGWTSCAPSVGGGCCPSGYLCNSASCSNTVGGGNQAKQTPATSRAMIRGVAAGFLVLALTAAVGMVAL